MAPSFAWSKIMGRIVLAWQSGMTLVRILPPLLTMPNTAVLPSAPLPRLPGRTPGRVHDVGQGIEKIKEQLLEYAENGKDDVDSFIDRVMSRI